MYKSNKTKQKKEKKVKIIRLIKPRIIKKKIPQQHEHTNKPNDNN